MHNYKGLEKFKENDLWGLRDSSTKKVLVEPKYDYIYPPNDKGISQTRL